MTPPSTALRKGRADAVAQSQETRSRILETATLLFETGGRHDITTRQIAAAAGVNSQLIYYYFEDKDGLFRAVLASVAGRVSVLLSQVAAGEGTSRSRLAQFIVEWVIITLAEARAVRLLHRAMLEGNEPLVAAIQQLSGAHAGQIASLIKDGVASGEFRADLDPYRCVMSLVGMVQYLALAEPVTGSRTNQSAGRKDRRVVAAHTAELFLSGLDATAGATPRTAPAARSRAKASPHAR